MLQREWWHTVSIPGGERWEQSRLVNIDRWKKRSVRLIFSQDMLQMWKQSTGSSATEPKIPNILVERMLAQKTCEETYFKITEEPEQCDYGRKSR